MAYKMSAEGKAEIREALENQGFLSPLSKALLEEVLLLMGKYPSFSTHDALVRLENRILSARHELSLKGII